MPDYQQGKIYCIRSHQTDDIYIGSTTQPLSKRMVNHRGHYKRWKNKGGSYTSSFELLEYGDCYIELIEEYPCSSNMELERREGQIIREMDCVNKCIPGRTRKEYEEDHKEEIKAYRESRREFMVGYHRQYAENNKEKIAEYKKKYRQENMEKIKETRNKYLQANKEQISQTQKQWYEANKERVLEQQKQQRDKAIEEKQHYCSMCDCAFGLKKDLRKHFNTIKHQRAITDKINSLDRFLYKQS